MYRALANQLAADLSESLETVRESILGKLSRVEDRLLLRTGDFAKAPLKRRKAVLLAQKAEIEALLADVYAEVREKLKEAGEDVIQATGAMTTAAMNTALGIQVRSRKLDRTIIDAWFEMSTVEGLLVNEWLQKLEGAAVNRIVAAGRQGMLEGLGAPGRRPV